MCRKKKKRNAESKAKEKFIFPLTITLNKISSIVFFFFFRMESWSKRSTKRGKLLFSWCHDENFRPALGGGARLASK